MCSTDASEPLFSAIPVGTPRGVFDVYVANLFISSDDVTVEVIFFGESPDTRTITVNQEASASEEVLKAKL